MPIVLRYLHHLDDHGLEIVKGLHKVRREERVQEFLKGLSAVEIPTLDLRSAELAVRIYADLERTGQPIGRADSMIAAIAIQNGLTLVDTEPEIRVRPPLASEIRVPRTSAEKVQLFRSLFRGREDVFPTRFVSKKTGRPVTRRHAGTSSSGVSASCRG